MFISRTKALNHASTSLWLLICSNLSKQCLIYPKFQSFSFINVQFSIFLNSTECATTYNKTNSGTRDESLLTYYFESLSETFEKKNYFGPISSGWGNGSEWVPDCPQIIFGPQVLSCFLNKCQESKFKRENKTKFIISNRFFLVPRKNFKSTILL